jgi:hypothetical protein
MIPNTVISKNAYKVKHEIPQFNLFLRVITKKLIFQFEGRSIYFNVSSCL